MTQDVTSPSRAVAYARLRDGILANEFAEDRPLSERGLAERLGLGRMPVREALKDLERDGLIEVVPLRGTFIRRLSFDEVRDLYEVRMGLETMAAGLAAQRGATPGLVEAGARLRALADPAAGATPALMQDHGVVLHHEVFRSARNRQLLSIYEGLQLQLRRNLDITRQADPERIRRTLAEHLAILDAVVAGDAALAQREMRRHLEYSLAARTRLLGVAVPAEGGAPA